MNRPNHAVVESNIPSAEPRTFNQFGRATAKQRREMEDLTAWMEEQDDAEVSLLVSETAAKNNRAYRRTMSF